MIMLSIQNFLLEQKKKKKSIVIFDINCKEKKVSANVIWMFRKFSTNV